jgi:thioredoxin 2
VAANALLHLARFAKIDTEQFPAISQRLQIRGLSLLILYHKGKQQVQLPGARPAANVEAFAPASLAGHSADLVCNSALSPHSNLVAL